MARHNDTSPEGRSVRVLRVGEQVRHVLSELLARGEVHDDVLGSTTVWSPRCACRPICAMPPCS
jgi:ribosome-binding factor A